jgi:hypothetical protein
MKSSSIKIRRLAVVAALSMAAYGAHASANLLTNGGFETGDYTGWSLNTQDGSGGALSIVANNGGTSPLSGFGYAANATGGNWFSITDQAGPGSYALTQSFTLAKATTVTISFQTFANNQASTTLANGRDYSSSPNQNAEVDLLLGGADAFTNASADIVATLYGPGADTAGNPNPWSTFTSTLALAAGTYQLRFAETDNQFFFQQGVDNVSVTTSAVPEPGSTMLMLAGLGAVATIARRRQRAAR